jgi:hypothetical protein
MTSEGTLSAGFTREGGGTGSWSLLLLALLLGAGLGAAAATGLAKVQASAAPDAAGRPAWYVRELPREWRWEGRVHRFDHMFRRPRPAPGS